MSETGQSYSFRFKIPYGFNAKKRRTYRRLARKALLSRPTPTPPDRAEGEKQ